MDQEDGITLVEVMVSILILGIVLAAYGGVMARNLRSLSDSQARQEASFVASQVIETLRELPVSSARMATTYDPTLVSCGGTNGQVDVHGDASVCEPLDIDPFIDLNRIDESAPWTGSSDSVTYATYATTAAGTDSVRVTVVVDYELTDGPKQVRRSTLVSKVNRG